MKMKFEQAERKLSEEFAELKKIIKVKKPLIHHITNNVTINDCANITLNWGALPVMAPAVEESYQMVESASALVLNLGTISALQLKSMLKAGKKANQLGIPIILDPVGVGAAKFRADAVAKIISELKIALVKGNKGEISFLAGKEAEIKGVESIGEYSNIEATAQNLAAELNTVVVVSSKTDLVTDEKQRIKITQGHSLMSKVVGTGCMLSSTLGVFAAAAAESKISLLKAAVTAVYYYSLAGEIAAQTESTPNKFKREFMDNIYQL